MAQGVRTQVARLTVGIALIAVVGSCGKDEPTGPASGHDPTPREVELATIDESELPDLVLDECQGNLRSGMHAVYVLVTLPGGEQLQVNARLPAALRTAGPTGLFVLRDGKATAIGEKRRPATTEETARLLALRQLVDAATFGPLRRAKTCRRTDPARFALHEQDDGTVAPIQVDLRPNTLLPAAFSGPQGTITIDDYLRTPVAWMPAQLTHPLLGTCGILFEKSDVTWGAGFFSPHLEHPEHGKTIPMTRIRMATDRVATKTATPTIRPAPAVHWLVLEDPGDWQARAELYKPLHDTLLAQNQVIAGFPILTRIDDRAVLVIPFRARSGDGLPELAAAHEVLSFPAGRELEVHPPTGDLAARRAEGERVLREALRNEGLQADGSIRCQPFVHLDEGPPAAEKLAGPTVRMFVRVR